VLGEQDAAAFLLEPTEPRRKKTATDTEDVAVLARELGGLAWLWSKQAHTLPRTAYGSPNTAALGINQRKGPRLVRPTTYEIPE
jgi:hypothetical protein